MKFVEDARWFCPPARQDDPNAPVPPGCVTLVGAGPGDPELLTLRAVKALRGARLVLYDHLVSKEVLRYVAEDADLIYVGKESSHHTLPQEAIIDLMVRLARSGRSLVRLKGGDGFIFGRGGEEAQALAQAGIAFDVVPGITAAQGAGAYAGIPLTHRAVADTLLLATAHRRETAEHADAPSQHTRVYYMGVERLATLGEQLTQQGLPLDTPCALVENGSRNGQRTLHATLATVAAQAKAHHIASPALLIVGEATRLGQSLAWFGKTLTPEHAQAQPAPAAALAA